MALNQTIPPPQARSKSSAPHRRQGGATARSMRSAVVLSPGHAAIQRQPLPELRPGAVRVALQGCGVCGSNLPVWEGRPWFQYPFAPGAPGHEGWGVVDAIGDDVETLRPGDRVALLSHHAFAEFDVAPAAHAVRLPTELDNQPFPGEALGCAVNVFRRSDIQPGQTVAIVGVGFLGAVLVQMAARAGTRVIALCRRRFAAGVAREMGAQEVVFMTDSRQATGAVKEITSGNGCDRVIEATGQQMPLDIATEITRERGRLIVAGYHQDGLRQVNMQLWNWRGLDVINAHERDAKIYLEGMRHAMELVVSGKLDPRPLYTHGFDLNDLPQALDVLARRPGDFLKAFVTL